MHRDNFNTVRLILVTPILLFVLLAAGCSSSKTVFDVPHKITGVIMMVGNEPFTRLAIRTGDDTVYLIKCGGSVRQILLSNQGRKVELLYIGIERKRPADEIDVVNAVVESN